MAQRRTTSTAPNLETIRIVLVEPRALVGLGIRAATRRLAQEAPGSGIVVVGRDGTSPLTTASSGEA